MRTMNRNSPGIAADLAYMALQEPPCMKAKAQDDNGGFPDVVDDDAPGADEQVNEPPPKPKAKPKSHLDVATEYEENHALFASQGISLYDAVVDYFCNEADTPATDDVLAAVKRRSDMLDQRWVSGEVADPFAAKK